jgi:hypothetical protein
MRVVLYCKLQGEIIVVQIFGDFDEQLGHSDEYLVIGFSPSSAPLKQCWRNNGLSADFLADYVATFFPVDDATVGSISRQSEIKGAVAYIANELLENAMKFNDSATQFPISISLQLYHDKIVIIITNTISQADVLKFQQFIQKLLSEDPQELYIHQLEQNAMAESEHSGLGLLTMINDYMARIGWKFETVQVAPTVTKVTTMIQLDV